MALTVRSRAPKVQMTLPLSIALATRQARKHVDKIMPGVMATVESRSTATADLEPVIVTTITFPREHPARHLLVVNLSTLAGVITLIDDDSSIVITRKR